MYYSTWSCMVVMMRLLSLGVPLAQLNGSICLAYFFAKGVGYVAGDQTSDCGGNAEWVEFCFFRGVFVEAEEVDVGEIMFDSWWEVVCVDLVENKVEVGGDRWDVGIDNVNEDVNGVCIDPRSFVSAGVSY